MAEHRMYVSLAAIAMAAAVAVWRAPGRVLPVALSALVAAALGTATVQRNRDYATALRIWTDTVQKAPRNPRAHTNLGNARLTAGDVEGALVSFRTAAQLDPLDPAVQVNLAGGLISQNRLDEAATAIDAALRVSPNDGGAWYNRGLVLLRRGDTAAAVAAFRRAVAADPHRAETHYNLGVALVQQRAWRDALDAFRSALQEDPRHAGALNNAAWLYATCPDAALRSASDALEWAQRAIAIKSQDDPELLDTLAAAYAESGRFEDAVRTAQRAASLAASSGRAELASRIGVRASLYAALQPYRMP
jgi:Flp pilus assembly protein TadD